ncbi:unnamed protein product [Ambrosiozyma monospora]|uniref:Unnamed protein product n=1 Tax=Ambrosiozyma monospora TaxID=43982 RepID=A0ACB5TDI9_AMBMO|nr:unnamed protein product [Ambrosiozyma monospora]
MKNTKSSSFQMEQSAPVPQLSYPSTSAFSSHRRSPSNLPNPLEMGRTSMSGQSSTEYLPPFGGSSQQPLTPRGQQQQLPDYTAALANIPAPQQQQQQYSSYLPSQQTPSLSSQSLSYPTPQGLYYQNTGNYSQQNLSTSYYPQTAYAQQPQQQQAQMTGYQYPTSSYQLQPGLTSTPSTPALQTQAPTLAIDPNSTPRGYDYTYAPLGTSSSGSGYNSGAHSPIRHYRPTGNASSSHTRSHSRSRSKSQQTQFLTQFVTVNQPQSLPKSSTAWSPEDDRLLRILKEEKKLGWREISTYFPSRTLNACQFRWRRIVIGVAVDKKKEDEPASQGNGSSSSSSSSDQYSKAKISKLLN